MRNTRFTNTLLGIIAINLTFITLIQLDIFPPKAYASGNKTMPVNTNYGLVPLNEDGSIDVNINSSNATMDVNLETLRGYPIGKSHINSNLVSIAVIQSE